MQSKAIIARSLAAAFVTGPADLDALVDRGSLLLGKKWRWLRPVAQRVMVSFRGGLRPRTVTVTRQILGDPGFTQAWNRHAISLSNVLAASPTMSPVPGAASWRVPILLTAGDLCDWLGIQERELEWFADQRQLESKRNQGRLRNYHYRTLSKRFGHVRLIESPKPQLKNIQRHILKQLLDHIPPHASAHGFRRGRSVKTFVSCHAGKRVVMRIDLQDFFPTIVVARVQALFCATGYPESVADLLAGLCTNTTPADVWVGVSGTSPESTQRASRLYSRPHLPQGCRPRRLSPTCARTDSTADYLASQKP